MANLDNFSKIVEESTICPICLKLSVDAVESECCGSIFCNNCILKIEKNECPICRNHNFKYHNALGIRKLIKNLPVTCTFNCGHKDSNENMKKHYHTCQYRDYKCSVTGCNIVCKRDEFLKHLVNEHTSVLINIGENFEKVFSPKSQKKIKDFDYLQSLKNKNEIIISNGSNKLNFSLMRPNYFDEIIDVDDEE